MDIEDFWFEGKPVGTCKFRQKDKWSGYIVEVGGETKTFTVGKCGTKEETQAVAEAWRKYVSTKKGLTKNRYRFCEDEDGDVYIEAQTQVEGETIKCDPKHFALLKSCVWTAYKRKDRKVYYAIRGGSTCSLFHRSAYSHLPQVDHKNRNGLDNRSKNIRDGSGRINARNKGIQRNNTSGTAGVFFEPGPKARWRAQYNDENDKKTTRSFAVSKYGEEKARELAEKWRDNEDKTVGLVLRDRDVSEEDIIPRDELSKEVELTMKPRDKPICNFFEQFVVPKLEECDCKLRDHPEILSQRYGDLEKGEKKQYRFTFLCERNTSHYPTTVTVDTFRYRYKKIKDEKRTYLCSDCHEERLNAHPDKRLSEVLL